MTNKSVQIPLEAFYRLVRYFYLEEDTESLYREIRGDIEHKMDSLVKHSLYSKSKNKSLSDEDREKARQEYLDMVGVHPSFRW